MARRPIPEPEPPPSDPELEKTIDELIYRMKRAPEKQRRDAPDHASAGRLACLRNGAADHGGLRFFMNLRSVAPRTEPGQILPLSRQSRTSGSRRGPRPA
jgi:hypothetical protein